eukprot:5593171-Pyramimonas_sp.AAC.1
MSSTQTTWFWRWRRSQRRASSRATWSGRWPRSGRRQQQKTALKRYCFFWEKKRRLTPSQLKLITERGNCGEVGRRHKECKNPRRPRDKSDGRGRPRQATSSRRSRTWRSRRTATRGPNSTASRSW